MAVKTKNKNKNIWRIILGGSVGNLTEWYNFLLYGYLAPVISEQFFPFEDKLLSFTFFFTLFSISFLVRPIGGVLFGWIGDNYGRQRALVISLIMIAIPTFLIGCLPTYHTIGMASPILLCILRIFQGLSAGGEHTGSAIYVAEHAPPANRALWVSTVPTSAALGVLFCSCISLLIVQRHWRLMGGARGIGVGPYFVSSALCCAGICPRLLTAVRCACKNPMLSIPSSR